MFIGSFVLCNTQYFRKDTRNVSVSITVQVIAAVPPIMEIGRRRNSLDITILRQLFCSECADQLLCLVGEGGKLFINPSSRLAVKATCSTKGGSDCSGLEYQWYTRPQGETQYSTVQLVQYSTDGTPGRRLSSSSSAFNLKII